jgi:hypothetical protein
MFGQKCYALFLFNFGGVRLFRYAPKKINTCSFIKWFCIIKYFLLVTCYNYRIHSFVVFEHFDVWYSPQNGMERSCFVVVLLFQAIFDLPPWEQFGGELRVRNCWQKVLSGLIGAEVTWLQWNGAEGEYGLTLSSVRSVRFYFSWLPAVTVRTGIDLWCVQSATVFAMSTVWREVAQELLNFFSRFLSFVSRDMFHFCIVVEIKWYYWRPLKSIRFSIVRSCYYGS